MNHQGESLRAYARRLKTTTGITREEIAEKIGIAPASLSRAYKSPRLSDELKERIQKGLGLPLNFFDADNTPAPAGTTTTAEPDELEIKRRELERRTAQLLELSEKYSALSEQFRKYVLENPPKQE